MLNIAFGESTLMIYDWCMCSRDSHEYIEDDEDPGCLWQTATYNKCLYTNTE